MDSERYVIERTDRSIRLRDPVDDDVALLCCMLGPGGVGRFWGVVEPRHRLDASHLPTVDISCREHKPSTARVKTPD